MRMEHTFLFTDLVGYTALTEEHGDDRAAEVATLFTARVRALAAAHRAEAVKALGDGMMVRCEDPALAMRLGLAIVGEARATPGLPAVRVGMHTGSAVQRDGDWYGAAVNVASRLCSAAGGDEVLVSEATCQAAGRRAPGIALGDERLHWLRNVRDPVRARVVSERECRLLERAERIRAAAGRLQRPARRRMTATAHVPFP